MTSSAASSPIPEVPRTFPFLGTNTDPPESIQPLWRPPKREPAVSIDRVIERFPDRARQDWSLTSSPWHSASATDNAALVCAVISELLRDDELYEEGEPRPSEQAMDRATALIREARRAMGAAFPIASVSAFEGTVRITWTRPHRGVRLICPSAQDRPAYIYHEEIQHGRSQNYDVVQNVTEEALVRWLRWLDAHE